MSFSSDTKHEIMQQPYERIEAAGAELAGALSVAGNLTYRGGSAGYGISIDTESAAVARYFFMLIKRWFGVSSEIRAAKRAQLGGKSSYTLQFPEDSTQRILEACDMLDASRTFGLRDGIAPSILADDERRRAFLAGAFLCGGTVSNPEKAYHVEIMAQSKQLAADFQTLLAYYDIDAKIVARKEQWGVYLKDSEQISTLLTLLGAYQGMMALENVKIMKQMRNSVNRVVNFETANVGKTVDAASRQIEAIEYIRACGEFERLPKTLREIAECRLENQDATLEELGQMVSPPVGKSGVNNRLRRLEQLAQKLGMPEKINKS